MSEKSIGWQKDPSEKVTQQLKVYVTEAEEQQLKQHAEILGMSFSSFARAVLTEEKLDVDPVELHRIRYELHKIGVNLNQLARKANAEDHIINARQLEDVCEQIINKLDEL